MRPLLGLVVLTCAAAVSATSAPSQQVAVALNTFDPAVSSARAAQAKPLKLGNGHRDALVATRFTDESLIFSKPVGKKWPSQENFIPDAMKNLGLQKAKGKSDDEIVLTAISNPATKAPLNVPVSWILEAAPSAPSFADAIPYLKAAEAELDRQLKVAEPNGKKLGQVLDAMVPELAKAHIPADEMGKFKSLAKDKQYEKLSAAISAKEVKRRTAAEKKFLDTLTPYQVYSGLLRGVNSTAAARKFAESKK